MREFFMQPFFVECFMKDGTINSFTNVGLPTVPPIGTSLKLIYPEITPGKRHTGYISGKVMGIRMTQDSPNVFLMVTEE